MRPWALALLFVSCRPAQAAWTSLGPGLRMLELGPFDTGSYINLNIARDMALLSQGGFQYSAYYDPQGQLIVSKRSLDSDQIQTQMVPGPLGGEDGSKILSDPHHYISLQIDGAGFLHLAYDHHGSDMHYRRSLKAADIGAWEAEHALLPSQPEAHVSYVSLIRLKSGNLLAIFRSGLSGHGDVELMRYDLKTRIWARLAWPLISGGGKSSAYLWRPIVSPSGRIHLAWTWRYLDYQGMDDSPFLKEHFSGFSNKDIHYACSDDEGRHWKRSDGSAYALPIACGAKGAHEAERILEIPMGEDMFNHFGSDYGPDGEPHFAFTHWNNATERIAQQWELSHSAKGWKASQASGYAKPIAWTRRMQDGLASTALARPSLLVDAQGRCFVLSRSHEDGDRIELFVSQRGGAGPWEKKILFDGSAGGWEPQMDLDLWHRSGGRHLQLLLAGITDRDIFNSLGRPNQWLEKIKGLNPWRDRVQERGGYYSRDRSLPVFECDPRLKENSGYLLDLDMGSLLRAGHE